MIIGGLTAAGKTGGMRTGYSSTYLPCRIVAGTGALIAALNKTSAIKYSATAEIRNIANTAWVTLPTVTYFQSVLRLSSTGVNSMSMTIRKPETWGLDSDAGELLRPRRENAFVRVSLTLTYQGTAYTKRVFYGRIVSYVETQGFSGGAINMQLEDERAALERSNPLDKTFEAATIYRSVLEATKAEGFSALCFFMGDNLVENLELGALKPVAYSRPDGSDYTVYEPGGFRTIVDAIRATIGNEKTSVDSSGRYFIGAATNYGNIAAVQSGGLVKLSDSGLASLTYSSRYRFNQASCSYPYLYLDKTQTPARYVFVTRYTRYTEASDVVKRGSIWSMDIQAAKSYADAVNLSIQTVFREVYGEMSFETRLNPFIEPDTFVLIDSTRGRKECIIAVQNVQHQYSCGRAVTYVSSAIVCPEGYL